jgi:DNA-binding NarL/FixJ family response regulator
MIRVAVVDEDPVMRGMLATAIDACDDMILVGRADSLIKATGMIGAGGYDVLLCELGLPDGGAIGLIRQEGQLARDTAILVMVMFATQGEVLGAIRAGAHGYLVKNGLIGCYPDAIRNVRHGCSPINSTIARQLLGLIGPTSDRGAFPRT